MLASHASISMTGNIKVSGQAWVACVIAGDNGTIRITGDISSSAKGSAMLQTVDGGFLTVTGKVTASADENAILCTGGRIELNGDIIQKGATVNIPTVSVSGGETVIRGSVIHNVQNKTAVYQRGGVLSIFGNIEGKGAKEYTVSIQGGEFTLQGNLTNASGYPMYVDNGKAYVEGSISNRNSQKYPCIVITGGSLTVSGEVEGTVQRDGGSYLHQ